MQSYRPPYVSASCEIHRNHGPKGVHGSVTLEFEPAANFSFVSSASWPAGDNYDEVVKGAVLDALVSLARGSNSFSCHLAKVSWHDVDSCASGFRLAARHATIAALGEIA